MNTRPLPKRTLNYIASGAAEGQRNGELLAAACQCRDADYSESETESLLLERATLDGLSEREAERTVASAYTQPKRDPLLRKNSPGQPMKTALMPEQKARVEKVRAETLLVARARSGAQRILGEYACGFAFYGNRSPSKVFDQNPCEDWKLLLRLFKSDDVLWIAHDTKHSAGAIDTESWRNFCRTRFRSVEEWLREPEAPGLYTCPSAFKAGVHSRCNENVIARRYLVLESDKLDKDQVCAVFRWMEQFSRLRAIVDTAGKSLHAWFELPALDDLLQLKIILPELGCDPALFTLSQPCRLPGGNRDGRIQSLLYLDSEGRP